MRDLIKEYIEIAVNNMELPEPIYEFGARQPDGQEDFADLRPYFEGKKYVGCDYEDGLGVDKVLDLHNIDIQDETVGTLLMFDTLEHVKYPYKALKEIHRVLKQGGVVIMSSVMDFPIHSAPYDYWRFTPEAFKSLLENFDDNLVVASGYDDFPHTLIGIGVKGQWNNKKLMEDSSNNWKNKWDNKEVICALQSKITILKEQINFLKQKRKENLFNKLKHEYNRFIKKLF